MKRITLFCILLFLVAVSTTIAESEQIDLPQKKHQVGVRIGTWSNNGGTPLSPIVDNNDSLVINVKDITVYLEGFYAYNLFKSVFAEASFGVVNRGDLQLYVSNTYQYSNLIIYPLLVQFKLFPLQSSNTKIQPFIGAGGGFYYAKQDIQFSNDYYVNYYQLDGDSRTDFNYVLSGGIDWQVRDNFSIELQTKYMPINFSKEFIGENDFSATTITVGFKYKYNTNKK